METGEQPPVTAAGGSPNEADRLLYQVWREHQGTKGYDQTFAAVREHHQTSLDRLISEEVRFYLEKIGMVKP